MYTPQPYSEAYLPEQDGHRVYYAQFGNPEGPTIVNCHGGPGSRSKAKHAATFDLTRYRVINVDQRGCGKSEPMGEVEHNTTAHLLADIERIRTELGIEDWLVSGSSWGSTLALAYAIAYPERVRGLLLSAIFLGDTRGDDWAFGKVDGAAQLFPDAWQQLTEGLAELGVTHSDNVPQALLTLLIEGDIEMQRRAAAVVASWEVNLLSRNIAMQYTRPEEVGEESVQAARIFLHYQANGYWLVPDQIREAIDTIAQIPACIVHGRYDVLCPLQAAWDIHRALPQSTLVVLPESHHVIAGDGAVARYYAFADFLATHSTTV